VADGTVDQDAAVAADAELDRGMDAAPVEPFDRLPDARGTVGRDADLARVHLGVGADGRDLREVSGDPAAADERGKHARILHGSARRAAPPA